MIPPAVTIPHPYGVMDQDLVTAFLEHVDDLVYFKDRHCRFVAVSKSKARRHGRENPSDLIGKSDQDFFSAEHAAQARRQEEMIMATGQSLKLDAAKIVWADGRESWVTTVKHPVRDASGEVIGTFGISRDITEARRTDDALERARRQLIEASRFAGMAEVATGVLHNVGNVLNSLNVSSTLLATGLRQSKAESLAKISALLSEHTADLGTFLTTDPKGRRVPEYLASLAAHTLAERDRLLAEVESLQKNVDHIREIVVMQQAYATMVGVVEPLDPASLLEDALRMNAHSLVRHDVHVVREFHPAPFVLAERGKVLQILVNLIRNAKHAADEGGASPKVMTLRLQPGPTGRVHVVVQDNGIGIACENLTRVFTHGFTTRKDGHGFGLHSSAKAARDLKGALSVHSDGPGRGARFTLDLPAAPAPPDK